MSGATKLAVLDGVIAFWRKEVDDMRRHNITSRGGCELAYITRLLGAYERDRSAMTARLA